VEVFFTEEWRFFITEEERFFITEGSKKISDR
jgi:hypothetical protein